jgi:NAD(P)-dependent dehydrogenase (short-subunit alcohol dehydrogenase family)
MFDLTDRVAIVTGGGRSIGREIVRTLAHSGVIMLTKSLAAEWATRGVPVNAVSPGYIGTELLNIRLKECPDWGKTWFDMTPMGRLETPTDVAYAVWHLASDAAAYATGTDLVVDGGYNLW